MRVLIPVVFAAALLTGCASVDRSQVEASRLATLTAANKKLVVDFYRTVFIDNDTASDWAFGLEGTSDTALIDAALNAVLEVGGEYLEAPVAEEGLAAAETVARMKGQWGVRDAYTEPMDTW